VQQLLKSDGGVCDKSLAFYITDDIVDIIGGRSIPHWNSFMNEALQAMTDVSPIVRQYAASTIGNAARQQIFAQMVPAAATQIHKVLQQRGERHRRRRAMSKDAKQTALAIDSCIGALGEMCEHHAGPLGTNITAAWSMWLANLPLKYFVEQGKKSHAQLVRLVAQQHPVLTSPQNLPAVLSVLAGAYKTNFSYAELDTEIVSMITRMGESQTKEICSALPEKQQKKVEHILKCARAGA